jgi:hypothetical protein
MILISVAMAGISGGIDLLCKFGLAASSFLLRSETLPNRNSNSDINRKADHVIGSRIGVSMTVIWWRQSGVSKCF